jgi:DNA-binding NtrC family response regulator
VVAGKLSLPVPRSYAGTEADAGKTGDGSELNLKEVEKHLIKTAVEKFHGNKRMAADALGISMRSLYRKLQEYKLKDV